MKVKKYIKKTMPIEAFIWKGYNKEDWQQVKDFLHITSDIRVSVNSCDVLKIHTLSERACDERDYRSYAKIGDYVVKVGCNEHEDETYRHIETYSPEAFKLLYRAKYSEGEV